MVWPAAVTTSGSPAGPMVKLWPSQVTCEPRRLANQPSAPPSRPAENDVPSFTIPVRSGLKLDDRGTDEPVCRVVPLPEMPRSPEIVLPAANLVGAPMSPPKSPARSRFPGRRSVPPKSCRPSFPWNVAFASSVTSHRTQWGPAGLLMATVPSVACTVHSDVVRDWRVARRDCGQQERIITVERDWPGASVHRTSRLAACRS